jgi:hypothetical protein
VGQIPLLHLNFRYSRQVLISRSGNEFGRQSSRIKAGLDAVNIYHYSQTTQNTRVGVHFDKCSGKSAGHVRWFDTRFHDFVSSVIFAVD